MIDFHSHILPYIDDGSKSFDMSIDMLMLTMIRGEQLRLRVPFSL